jgi:hypothetical protein
VPCPLLLLQGHGTAVSHIMPSDLSEYNRNWYNFNIN